MDGSECQTAGDECPKAKAGEGAENTPTITTAISDGKVAPNSQTTSLGGSANRD